MSPTPESESKAQLLGDIEAELRRREAAAIAELNKDASEEARKQKAPPQQTPSVGRIVHYVAYGTPGSEFPVGVCRAAIITEVDEVMADGVTPRVGLCVLNPSGQFFNRHVPHDGNAPGERAGGTWHWPEYVPAR